LFHAHEPRPLVFIETSLIDRQSIEPLLQCDAEWHNVDSPTHAVFYAIIATQPSLFDFWPFSFNH
jgi:hypothetical protein